MLYISQDIGNSADTCLISLVVWFIYLWYLVVIVTRVAADKNTIIPAEGNSVEIATDSFPGK